MKFNIFRNELSLPNSISDFIIFFNLFSSKVIGIFLFKISDITFIFILILSILFIITLSFTILKYIFLIKAINLT